MKLLFLSIAMAGSLSFSAAPTVNIAEESARFHDCEVTVGTTTVNCNDCNCRKVLRDLLKAASAE
jgi:hypothetical protein